MLLVMDIGNTNIKVGIFKNREMHSAFRLAVDKNRTADEYGVQIESFFTHFHLRTTDVTGIILSSVVPSVNYTLMHMIDYYFPGIKPLEVHAGLRTELFFFYEYPQTLGADRICNAVAAHELYGGNCITIDFGTATTFGVMRDNYFLGGMICPGFKVSSNALIESAALLPKVEFINPGNVIGVTTEQCIQSGLLFGYVGQVEYLVQKVKDELGTPALVIATGGMGDLIANETSCIDIINPTLTLLGLDIIYHFNS